MISIKDKQDCCGCGACAARCPKQCITLQRDSEGFLYPQVDAQLCIECGLCEKVCPVLHQAPKEQHPRQTLAAVNRDESVRETSSSGGVFTLLAEKVLARGGVVFGARYDEQWQVVIDYTESIEGLAAFRGSKYVQARTADTFKQCEAFLKAGRQVLYSGTPCQIAGLHRFLRKSYPNLLAVDFICHGTPSPKVWSKYLDEVVAAGRQRCTVSQQTPRVEKILVLSRNHPQRSGFHLFSLWRQSLYARLSLRHEFAPFVLRLSLQGRKQSVRPHDCRLLGNRAG